MIKIWKHKIRKKLVSDHIGLFYQDTLTSEELESTVKRILEDICSQERLKLPQEDKDKIISDLVDEFIGFGPIDSLIKDPQITEIMINGPGKIYIEKKGKKALTNITFDDEQQLMYMVYKIIAPTRRHVDESYPYTDVSLKDGSRVNIIIPPLALDGPTVTIRKFLREIATAEDLINLGTLDRRMADFLIACIKAKINIIFTGATGAGKTTTVGVLSTYLPDEERIITIEDTAELHLKQEHVVRLEAKQPNIEGRGEVTIRDLFRNSLRMRPERIILGEIRGAEALDMLQAICSGHTGSLSVIHSNSPEEVIYRLETMILTSGIPISMPAIHRQIAAAIDLIVQQERLSDGSRRITQITQISGLKEGQIKMEDIFFYDIEGVDAEGSVKGEWKASGVTPVFFPRFKKAGIDLAQEIFNKD